MTENEQRKVLREFQEKGYGYTDYTNNEGYGISIVKQERLNELAKSVGDWNQVMFLERGWDNHQDVYAFEKYVK